MRHFRRLKTPERAEVKADAWPTCGDSSTLPVLHPLHIRSDASFAELVNRVTEHDELCLDFEFHTEGRYFPRLCLVQLAFGTELFAVDPSKVQLAALGPVLESASVRKIIHDGRQDLPIIARAAGVTTIRNVFDTQIAAAFSGFGSKIGYANLVRELFDLKLDKSLQVSDWTRELSAAQIEYALDDVRYLSRMVAMLQTRLSESGRIAWVLAACEEAAVLALSRPDPEKLYRRVSATSQLQPRPLGVLRELAKWRDRVAQSLDKPAPSVAGDLALKSMALCPPRDRGALESVRGLGAGRNQPWANELLKAILEGESRPEANHRLELSKQQEAQVDGLVSMLSLGRRFVATRDGIGAELLADQAELRALAEWQLNQRPDGNSFDVFGGWRRDVIGDVLLRILSGTIGFRADASAPSGIAVIQL